AASAIAPTTMADNARPTQPLPHPSASSSVAAPSSTALTTDRIQKSLVTVEVAGRATGIGVVLEGDGRMVTSLTAVGPGDLADVRYSDGHVVHTRAGHKDAVLDLALLVPLSGRYTTGLLASEQDPMTVELRTASLAAGRPSLVSTKLKVRVDAHAHDGTSLSGAWELDRTPPSGAPLLDPDGRVLGVGGHACRNPSADAGAGHATAAACSDVTVVIPILSIRMFLARTPSNAVSPAPWLGINGTPDVINGIRGVRVQAVAPRSPAERGGLHTTSDMIVVADGQPLDTPERLAEIVSKHAVGDTLKLSVFAAGHYREVDVTLQASP
ncbi:MAG TPA: S1C family serine protease, partial [Polyangiaceae bacterium]|nr:S1C family serine protease [Polyangiaceae bacterium]